jgi:demethyllactenocin mycarosyltransferase
VCALVATTSSPERSADRTVLVFILPGIGHYLPIASLLHELDAPGEVIIAAELPSDSTVAERSRDDGFTFLSVPSINGAPPSSRLRRGVARGLRTRLAPRLAARGRTPIGLPRPSARFTFALGTQVLPIVHSTAAVGAALEQLLDATRPDLILTEYDSPWFGLLAAERAIPYARYTTGPVGAPAARRPVSPAGFDPLLPGSQAVMNRVLYLARSLRRRRADRTWRKAVRSRGARSAPSAAPIAQVSFATGSLDDYAACPQEAYTYVGASPYRLRDEVLQGGDRDTIFVTWGSTGVGSDGEVLERLLPALRRLSADHRVVVQTDDDALRALVEEGPEELEVRDPSPAPLYDEYRRSALVIGHGGYGTIIESLCFGTPVLTVPRMVADRLETGQRVLQAGVGLTLDRATFRAEDALEAMKRILGDPSFRERAQAVGADLCDRTKRDELIGALRASIER